MKAINILFSAVMASLLVGGCGSNDQADQANHAEIDAAVAKLPSEIVMRVPVVNGERRFDQAEVRSLANNINADGAALATGFDHGQALPGDMVLDNELDDDSSTASWWGRRHARYGSYYQISYRQSYRHTYYQRSYFTHYSYNAGYYHGGYYYCNYRRASWSWFR